ncbi:ABC transporter ATP-binding protein [Oceanicoccus sagamiensis]|uniref:ABC transporter n=1 Tax=Oceanicoccus sagamiensis TaxID=716816 RepID=A0A1X9NMA9_9GAMM|nr:ABC transporter ATP-binding protein [Oceanicoccus sagamiensis]ARN76489.1 ABC transporter [Oceanicoccus sagamiensis]
MTTALSIKQLSKAYNNGFQALKGIDLEVEEGDFFALLGPNGAGKSTTIGIICSLVRKTAGQVSVFGYDIDTDFSLAKKQIGIVPQEFNFPNFEQVFDILVNQAGYYGLTRKLAVERTEKYLKALGLWEKRFDTGRSLSGGMKRRLMIARALVHEPRLLILDEPSAGVDIEMRRSMWAFLKQLNDNGTTIILTTHYLEEAESLCRHIAIINHGEIAEHSSMKQLLSQLHKEVVILDTSTSLSAAPSLPDFEVRLTDGHTLEVEIEKGQSVNTLFAQLTAAGIDITSMRNKANRLEELFVNLVNTSAA